MKRISQDKIFAEFEGDRWFERDQKALEQFHPENDLPLKVMTLYGLKPRKVLEVGEQMASGWQRFEHVMVQQDWSWWNLQVRRSGMDNCATRLLSSFKDWPLRFL